MNQIDHYRLAIYEFGGIEGIGTTVPISTLNYIFTYPGLVKTINLWLRPDDYLDITEYGFVAGGSYTVLDSKFKALYSVKGEANFGLTTQDLNFLSQVKHGEYYHLHYTTNTGQGKSCLLLWMCTQPPERWREHAARLWSSYHKSKQQSRVNEIFIDLSQLSSSSLVHLLSYEANPDVVMDLARLQLLAKVTVFNPIHNVYLRPTVNTWYAFIQDNKPLQVIKATGEGLHRLVSRDNIHSIQLQGRRNWGNQLCLELALGD